MTHFRKWMLLALIVLVPALITAQEKSSRLPKPDDSAVTEARAKVHELFAKDYREAKNPESKAKLAEQMAKRAADAKESPVNRFGLFCEARDLALQGGDVLSAFRIVEDMAKTFDVSPFQEKIDLIQKVSKVAKGSVQQRSVAIASLKLADDAAEFEQYDVAKECCNTAVTASLAAQEPPLQTRAVEQLKRFEQLLIQSQAAKEAEQKLKDDPTDTAASLSLGRFRCFVHRDWPSGLPLLRQSSDTELAALATSDLRGPTESKEQTTLATEWLKYAQKQKDSLVRASAAERSAFWFETAMKSLAGLDRVALEPQLEAAYELSCGRNFKKLLARTANGVEVDSAVDCERKAHPLRLKSSFDLRKSWLFSLEFKPINLDGGWHSVFFWGDPRDVRDPLCLRLNGNRLCAFADDCLNGRRQELTAALPASVIGQWVDVKFVHDALAGEFELHVNHRLIRREAATITPAVDKRMPLVLGSSDIGHERFGGEVRKFWLGNIP